MLACNARQLSSHTIEDYQRTLGKFLKHAGDMDEYDQETYMLNQKYLDDLIKSISGKFNRIMDKPNE